MTTECNPAQLEFHALGGREVVGRFGGGRLTSDGGGLLLRGVDQRLGTIARLNACFSDDRNPYSVEHGVQALVAQRVYGLALLVGKAEVLPGKANPRFVVTNLPESRAGAQRPYEKLFCVRGEMENRIKEQQLGLFADRASTRRCAPISCNCTSPSMYSTPSASPSRPACSRAQATCSSEIELLMAAHLHAVAAGHVAHKPAPAAAGVYMQTPNAARPHAQRLHSRASSGCVSRRFPN